MNRYAVTAIDLNSVQSGPFGPTTYNLGNGLTAVNTYDTLGRNSGGWVCAGSSQPTCTGGTLEAYGYTAQRTGTHVTQTCDTVLGVWGLALMTSGLLLEM